MTQGGAAVKKFLTLCLLAGLLLCLLPLNAHAANCYAPCVICGGSVKCGLCDPSKNAGALGDGYLECPWCHGTGSIICGTNTSGDGKPIGCDGSGKMPDGSVCPVCGGEGRYACDGCQGALVVECKCREAGQPGKCHVCFGTGWRTVDSQGQPTNTSPVYPPDGATIDTGVWGRHEVYTYDASRFGYGVSPYQAMDNVGATTIDDFYRALRGASFSTPAPNEGEGPNEGPGPAAQIPHGQDQPQPPDSPQPADGSQHPDEPHEPEVENPYEATVLSDEALVAEVADGSEDMIFLLSRRVAGSFLLTVQVLRSRLSEQELRTLQSMTAQDFAVLKDDLEHAANGMSDWLPPPDPVHMREENICVRWRIGEGMTLPFRCDLLLQIPEMTQDRDVKLYRLEDGVLSEERLQAVDHYSETEEYLIFSTDRLGEFVLTDADVTLGAMPAPEERPEQTSAPEPVPEPDQMVPGQTVPQAEPGTFVHPVGTVSNLPYFLVALGGIIVAVLAVLLLIKKRKQRRK